MDLIIVMNEYNLDDEILSYTFGWVTGINSEMRAYFPEDEDISSLTRETLLHYIKNVHKRLVASGGVLPFTAPEDVHGFMKAQLGDEEAFCLGVEASLSQVQPLSFEGAPHGVEEEGEYVDCNP